MTLVEFIRARLDEDEARARPAVDALSGGYPGDQSWAPGHMVEAADAYLRRFNPARVLTEVAAKRRIVDEWRRGDSDEMRETAWVPRLLALPYADHPDYREEWTP